MERYSYSINSIKGDIVAQDSYRPSKIMHIVRMGHLKIKIKTVEKVIPKPRWYVESHEHKYYFEFHIIPHGKGIVSIQGNRFMVREGCFYITGPNIEHWQLSDEADPMAEYCIQAELETVDSKEHSDLIQKKEVLDMISAFSKVYPYPFQDTYDIKNKFDELFDEVEKKTTGYITNFQNIIIKILINIYKAIADKSTHMKSYRMHNEMSHEYRIDKINKFISVNYMKKISIADIEKDLFLSKKQINRIMQKEWNQTFNEYLQMYRFNKAKKMARETDLPVYEIAERCGFSGTNHLYQTFKRFNCPPPLQLRNDYLEFGGKD